jgi:hypothetical protein
MNYPAASHGASKARQQHEAISKQASGYGPAGQSGGNLTPKEKAKLTREQNRASRDICRMKHNKRQVNTQ